MFSTFIGWAGAFLVLGGCTFALSLGGKIEKIAATAYLLLWILGTLAKMSLGSTILADYVALLLDTSVLIIFAGLVWKSPNNWPVWATALQLIAVTLQFLYIIHIKPPLSAYITIVNFTALGIIIAMVVGTFMAWQERAVFKAGANDIGRYS